MILMGRLIPTRCAALLVAALLGGCSDNDSGGTVDAGPLPDSAAVADSAAADAGPPPPLTWSAPENISQSPTFSDIRLNWGNSIAVTQSGTVHVVWREVTDSSGNIVTGRVAHRRRSGSTWSAVQDITSDVPGTGHPKVAASGDHVYIAWHVFHPDVAEDDEILVAMSDADGAAGSFTAGQVVVSDAVVTSQSPLQEMASTPSLAAAGDWVYLVWADDRVVPACGINVSEIYLRASDDRGTQWAEARLVSEPDCRSSWTPTVAAADTMVHVAWTDERHSAADCGLGGGLCEEEEYYRRLADNGATLDSPEIRLTNDEAGSMKQSWAGNIVAWGANVHYAWMDNMGGDVMDDWNVFHRRSLDRGTTWDAQPVRLSNPAAGWRSARPTVAAEGTAVHVVWMELQGDTAGLIFHVWSNDLGETWSSSSDVTAGTGSFAIQPSVACRGGRVHVVWNDLAEIFYAASL